MQLDNIKTENPQIIEYLSSGSYISKITTMPVNKLDNINITDVSIKEITNDDSTIILTSNSNYYATLEAKARYDMKQIIGNNPWGKVFGTGIGKRRDVEGTFIKGQRLEILKQDKDSLNDLYYLVLHPKKKNEKYWIPVISTTQFDPRLIFELKTGPYSFIGHIIFNMRAPNSYSDGSFNELKADYNFIGEQNLDLSDCYIIVFNHNTVKVILKKGEEENKIEEYDGIIKKDNCWLITDNSNIQLNLPEKKFELIRLNAVK
ncbi:MAG: hypothetical protein B6I20_09625 [Bacteroidetes bacterium 4572_117]|nr:MAG: hypothetical protein B6I20_09625 [Bacteroidetes bacterium 4572_117]